MRQVEQRPRRAWRPCRPGRPRWAARRTRRKSGGTSTRRDRSRCSAAGRIAMATRCSAPSTPWPPGGANGRPMITSATHATTLPQTTMRTHGPNLCGATARMRRGGMRDAGSIFFHGESYSSSYSSSYSNSSSITARRKPEPPGAKVKYWNSKFKARRSIFAVWPARANAKNARALALPHSSINARAPAAQKDRGRVGERGRGRSYLYSSNREP